MLIKLAMHASLISMLVSCQPPAAKDSGNRPQPPTNTTTQQNNQTSSLADIGASSLMVLQGSGMVSLASIAAKSTADLTVFQFAGVTCESCKTEGPYVASVLSKYGSKVSRMVIFPNKASEYTAAEYSTFTRTYAASAPYVIDDSLAVIKKVRSKTTQYFGVYILVAKDGKGQILNQDEAYKGVEAAVAKALNQ
jgi:hypothetical protein